MPVLNNHVPAKSTMRHIRSSYCQPGSIAMTYSNRSDKSRRPTHFTWLPLSWHILQGR